jgi:hypothetical protein
MLLGLFLLFSFSFFINSNLSGSSLTLEQANNLWTELFLAPRGTACKSEEMRKRIISQLSAQKNLRSSTELKVNNKFSWIKKWGYGPASYLFDYLDPVFQDEITTAFKNLYQEALKESSEDTQNLSDPFKSKPKSDRIIYESSVNLVQLSSFMKKSNWFTDPGQKNYAINFILNYDTNGDGRLNARELILGAIKHNSNMLGSGTCKNCFGEIVKKIDAMFLFLDCNSDGSLSSSQLWNGLKQLKRPDTRYNIFSLQNKDSIRTSAINDFIIKNGYDAVIDRDNFRAGILLGYWDRQTTEHGVLKDDIRNLKDLRWKDFGMTDTTSFMFMKEKMQAELIAKAEK